MLLSIALSGAGLIICLIVLIVNICALITVIFLEKWRPTAAFAWCLLIIFIPIVCLLIEATLVTLVVTIVRRRKCDKYEALYRRFTIMGLLHEYGIENDQLTDKETQLAVFQRLTTDTQFPSKFLLKIFNTLCDSKLTIEDMPK